MGIPMLMIRWSQDRLIFNMGSPILVRRHLYIETAPSTDPLILGYAVIYIQWTYMMWHHFGWTFISMIFFSALIALNILHHKSTNLHWQELVITLTMEQHLIILLISTWLPTWCKSTHVLSGKVYVYIVHHISGLEYGKSSMLMCTEPSNYIIYIELSMYDKVKIIAFSF